MTAAQAIVACMKKEGADKTFCVPGESYLPVLDALHDEPSIDVISTRHEGGAAFMAEGYAKAALKPGIVLATRAVGAANLSIGVHTAYQDSTPMVVFLGQVHRKFRGREGFQEVDLDRYFGHIAKWAVEVTDAERMPEIVQRAFRIAKSGRPGPVVIALPEDVLPEEAEMHFGPVTSIPKPAPSQQEVTLVERLLTTAKKPVIIAGGGVKNAQAEDDLVAFAEKYKIPVLAAFRRQDAFPNDHPLYAGHLGLGTNREILQTVNQADVIIALGTRLSEVTTQDYSIIRPDKKLIHVAIDHDTIGKVYGPDIGIVADLKEALQVLMYMEIDGAWGSWANARRQAYEKVSRIEASADDVINKQIIAHIAKRLPQNALLTTDAGNFAGWLHAFYPFREKHTYVGPTSGAMGYGMPAALGAKLAFPEKIVVSLSGDGGFMMTGQELETAVRNNIPVICLVFNNNMYGTIRMHQEMHYPKKVEATDLGDVSFKDLAISVGADGYSVRTIEEFEVAFDQAIQKLRPAVIEIITGKEQISVSSTITQIRDR
ncbi:acetolactate synthase [Virgibacillus sp. NKC19-16]|uniref:thiamine pyrophosphate-dependent enzyme n=1 Tax=Virgibacillus salidurans TaxID=2831673 RepID=UPI001F24EE4C|nr:thiamine pyrophosphate-dependent enzyme [Virgibacillus sp. NKC19-16]UJL48185.1 acetolactate synthase [Virgibacillus sp. NKC19-16]